MPADGARKPAIMWMQRGLAGAVGAEQAGDARADRSCVTSLTATTLPYQRETSSSSSTVIGRSPAVR